MTTSPRSRLVPTVALGAALGIGALATVAPLLGVIAAAVMFAVSAAVLYPDVAVRLWSAFTALSLAGYAFVGKGFAYLGRSPVFIGEFALALGLLALCVRGGTARTMRSPIMMLLAAFALWCATQTVPYVGQYGLDALRDAALWGYGAFTLAVATLLARPDAMARALDVYWAVFRWLPFWAPVFGIVSRVAGDRIPSVPGTDVQFLIFKPGDMAVHLAGAGVFLMLGLREVSNHVAPRRKWDWVWWAFWLASLIISVSASRGGLLAAALAFAIVIGLRPRTKWWKPAVVALVAGGAFFASDIAIDVGLERKISSRQLVANLMSIVDTKQAINLSGTREWRLAWWRDIVHYTVFGRYRWTGKGFGINLADDDGYQGGVRDYVPNRSPHNVQMTVLARAGVPGLVLWVLLQAAFVTAVVRAYLRARRLGWDWWGRVNLWILAYWAALLVNGSFDVYIEGPQGGIWFWCIMGFGLAALEAQRTEARR